MREYQAFLSQEAEETAEKEQQERQYAALSVELARDEAEIEQTHSDLIQEKREAEEKQEKLESTLTYVKKFSKLKSNDLKKLKEELKKLDIMQLKDRNIQFFVKNKHPCYLNSDPDILFQILLNLALNSIEAIDREGHMSIDYRGNETTLSIIVEDDGPGIPVKQRARIFEPFYTTKKRGTGLGLTVTKKLIENLYGYIELQHTRHGAAFKVTLPTLGTGELKL